MMRNFLVLAGFGLTCFCLGPGPAFSAAVPFFNRPAFLAVLPTPTNYDFEPRSGFPIAPRSLAIFASGLVSVSTDSGDPVANISSFNSTFGQAIGGQAGGAVDNFQALRLSFTPPVFAVGFDDLDLTPDEVAVVTVSVSGGLPPQTFAVTDTDGDFNTAGFFGVISTDPITSIQVYSAEASTAPPGSKANLIDNVVLSPVPEPSTLIMAAIGLLALVTSQRFRCGGQRQW